MPETLAHGICDRLAKASMYRGYKYWDACQTCAPLSAMRQQCNPFLSSPVHLWQVYDLQIDHMPPLASTRHAPPFIASQIIGYPLFAFSMLRPDPAEHAEGIANGCRHLLSAGLHPRTHRPAPGARCEQTPLQWGYNKQVHV